MVIVDLKRSSTEENRSKLWELSKSGYIRPKYSQCNLVLGVFPKRTIVRGSVPQDVPRRHEPKQAVKVIEGLQVGLVVQDMTDPWQRWQFDMDGYLHNEVSWTNLEQYLILLFEYE